MFCAVEPGALEEAHSHVRSHWFPSLLHEAPPAVCTGRVVAPPSSGFCLAQPRAVMVPPPSHAEAEGEGEGASLTHSGTRELLGLACQGLENPVNL